MRNATCSECGVDFACTDKGPRPRRCPDCKTKGAPRTARLKRVARVARAGSPVEDAGGGLEPLTVIDAFGLDYNLGSAVRFILERADGDERENLEAARTYLDRALARLAA